MSKKKFNPENLNHLESFKDYIDPKKSQENWNEIWENATEEQKLFFSVFQLEGSLYGRLVYLNKELSRNFGHGLRAYIRYYSFMAPNLMLYPIYRKSIEDFRQVFPFKKLNTFYKKTNEAISSKSFLLPENKKLQNIILIDWPKLFSTLEDYAYFSTLYKSLKFHNPMWLQEAEDLLEEYSSHIHNYFQAKTGKLNDIGYFQANTSTNDSLKFKKNKAAWEGLYRLFTKNFENTYEESKTSIFKESFTISEFDSSLRISEAVIDELQKLNFFKELLHNTLSCIHVKKNQETTKLLFLHDIFQIVFPSDFTTDKTFDLKMGPMYNPKGNLDLEIKREKISEVKLALGIPING